MPSVEGCDISCGVAQLFNLTNKPLESVIAIGDTIYGDECKYAFVTWSDVWTKGGRSRGSRLYRFIRKTFPSSSVVRTRTARNPNSGNEICVYVWKVPKFRNWWLNNSCFEPDSES